MSFLCFSICFQSWVRYRLIAESCLIEASKEAFCAKRTASCRSKRNNSHLNFIERDCGTNFGYYIESVRQQASMILSCLNPERIGSIEWLKVYLPESSEVDFTMWSSDISRIRVAVSLWTNFYFLFIIFCYLCIFNLFIF